MACITLECCPESLFTYESADVSLLSGLEAYWKMEEATGDRLDATGNGSSLSVVNGASQVDGKIDFGVGLARAGTEYLSAPTNEFLEFDGDFTIAGWVNFTTLITGSSNRQNTILSKFNRTNGLYGLQLSYWHISNLIELRISQTGKTGTILNATTFGPPSTGTWYFVCAWYDSSTESYSIQINNGVADTAVSDAPPVASTNDFIFGNYMNNTGNDPNLDGRVDEWGKWSRVLNAAERTFLWNFGNGRTYDFS